MRRTIVSLVSILLLATALLATGCAASHPVESGATTAASPSQPQKATPSPTASATLAPKTYKGTTVLVMGSADADFTENKPIYPFTYMILFIDPVNSNLTIVSLHADTAMEAKDENGNSAGTMPLCDIYAQNGIAGVVKTLEARLGVPVDKTLLVNGSFTEKLLGALGPVEIDVAQDLVNDGSFKEEMGVIKEAIRSLESVVVPETGKRLLTALQIMAAAACVPESIYSNDYVTSIIAEESRYRLNRELIALALAPVLRDADTAAFVKVFSDNENQYSTDIDGNETAALLENLQESCAGDVKLLQLPLGELTSRKEAVGGKTYILLEGGPIEVEREALRNLLVR
jgi:hypothetical protein